MNEIVELAERLGKGIAGSPQSARLRAARKALDAEPDAAQLLKDYNAQLRRIAELERDRKPIEIADKHKARDLQGKLAAMPAFKELTAAQVEYVDLMRKVNEAIAENLD